ncbi:MAG: hypothetical protein U9N85_13210 [Bacteroidota bacterium]|nr:hypothetical protein [Bacteroidota bacterium]
MNNYMDTVKFLTENSQTYWWSIYAPIAVWLLLVLGFFVLLLKKYTFGNWTPEHPNPFAGETFSMPRGVFRGILTLTLLFVSIIIELANVRIIGLEKEIHQLLVAFQMMIAFYFGSKVMHHITATEGHKTKFITRSQTEIHAGSDSTPGDFYSKDSKG